jgi:hypothetical protein
MGRSLLQTFIERVFEFLVGNLQTSSYSSLPITFRSPSCMITISGL